MPNAPKTPTRTFRCPDWLWNDAKKKAAAQGLTVTEILLAALLALVEEEPADLLP